MELEHSFTIPVTVDRAWQALLDVEQVGPCMPGATVESVEGDVINGRIKVKVGPVMLTYAGTAHFTERDEASRTVVLEASGKETRGSGTAAATVRSSLQSEGDQTRVVVRTSMSVTGRPAQFGRGVMADVGGKIIEKFASNLAAQLASGSQAAAPGVTGNGAAPGALAPGAAAQPIEELVLTVRSYNSLKRAGIHTVGELVSHDAGALLAIPDLGPQSLKEIREKLSAQGLRLTGEAAPSAAAGAGAPTAARPPDEEAIDLLSVAGFPVLKRALPALGVVAAIALVFLRLRKKTRKRSTGA